MFGNNDNWRNKKTFIIYLFYNNERKAILISDNFPFELKNNSNYWICSKPASNEIFCKIIEKAYLKYQLIYGKYNLFNLKDISSIINKIIFKDRGYEKEQ